ncbi:MAG: hypothetical protein AB7V50_05435, partial [Vampirovibrionia bacterium]
MLQVNQQKIYSNRLYKLRNEADISFKSAATAAKAANTLKDTFKTVDLDKISRIEKFFLKLSTRVPDKVFAS